MSARTGTRAGPRLDRRTALLAAAVVALEALLVAGHAWTSPDRVTTLRYAVYPFVWIDAALLGMWVATPPRTTVRRGALAAGVAAAYFGVLALLTGLIDVYPPGAAPLAQGWQLSLGPPGWAPRVAYVSDQFYAYFVPYRVVGYLGLAYLVYVALLDAFRAALPAVVGVGSCVGCALPLVAPGFLGATAGAGATLSGVTVDVSTAVFLLSVGLLAWRPAQRME